MFRQLCKYCCKYCSTKYCCKYYFKYCWSKYCCRDSTELQPSLSSSWMRKTPSGPWSILLRSILISIYISIFIYWSTLLRCCVKTTIHEQFSYQIEGELLHFCHFCHVVDYWLVLIEITLSNLIKCCWLFVGYNWNYIVKTLSTVDDYLLFLNVVALIRKSYQMMQVVMPQNYYSKQMVGAQVDQVTFNMILFFLLHICFYINLCMAGELGQIKKANTDLTLNWLIQFNSIMDLKLHVYKFDFWLTWLKWK